MMCRFSVTSALWIGAAFLLLIGGIAAPVDASDASTKPWRPIKTLRFFEGDQVDFSSQIYRRGSQFLVVPSDGDQIYVLSKQDNGVVSLGRDALTNGDEGPGIPEEAIDTAASLGSYEKRERGRWLVWQRGEDSLSVRPKPDLIGMATLEQVLEEKPSYREDADGYEPVAESVAGMRDGGDELRYVVGFGTWCPTCAAWTPRFIKAFEETGLDASHLAFVSADPELSAPAELLEQYGIEAVPTFIVMRGGEEIGRVELKDLDRDPDTPIETRLAAIIDGKGS